MMMTTTNNDNKELEIPNPEASKTQRFAFYVLRYEHDWSKPPTYPKQFPPLDYIQLDRHTQPPSPVVMVARFNVNEVDAATAVKVARSLIPSDAILENGLYPHPLTKSPLDL